MDSTLNLSESLWGGLKIPYIFQTTKYNLTNLYENPSLNMSKLKKWSTLILAMQFLKI